MEKSKEKKVISFERPLMPECNGCIWYESEPEGRSRDCINRNKMICKLYIEKLFEDLKAGTR
jgi:hypothetical protein